MKNKSENKRLYLKIVLPVYVKKKVEHVFF